MKEVVVNQGITFNQRLIQIAMVGCLMASTAMASPEGASVVMGDVGISGQGKSAVTVEQKSARAVINWKSFDTKKDESITFKQPDASAIAVNIVTGKSPTNFQGSLEANGKIILINNNGIVFSKTSHVDVAGMIATTMQMDMESFADKDQVNFAAGKDMKPDAKIENKGTITVAEAGLVGLVAPIVKNSGVIEAELGTVHLASGNAFTVDMVGDGLVSLAVSGKMEDQLVEHTGEIHAKGGKVYMTAAVAEKMVDEVINVKGLVEAQTVEVKQGKILISFAKEEPVKEESIKEDAAPVKDEKEDEEESDVEIKDDAEEVVAEEPAPVVEEPIVEEVVAEEPAPVVEEPVVEEVVAEEPAPVVEEPIVEEVVAEEPAPVVEEPVVEEIVAEEPAPVVEEPVVEEIVAEELAPVVDEPIVEEVVAEEPAPVVEEPVVEEVVAEEPVLADADSNEIKIDLSGLQVEDSVERRRARVFRRIKEWYAGIVRPGEHTAETIAFDTYVVRLGDLSIFDAAKREDDRI